MCILSDKIISLSLPLSLVLCSQDSRYNRLRKTSVIKRKARKLTNGKFINKASALWMLFLHPLLLSSIKLATITIVIKDYTASFFLVTILLWVLTGRFWVLLLYIGVSNTTFLSTELPEEVKDQANETRNGRNFLFSSIFWLLGSITNW